MALDATGAGGLVETTSAAGAPAPRLARAQPSRLGRACLKLAGATGCRGLASGRLVFSVAEGKGRSRGEDRDISDRLRQDAREVLWDLSTEAFDCVLKALEMGASGARPADRATLLAALDIWCELNPLPAYRQEADHTGTRVKRHAMRARLQAPRAPWPAPRPDRLS
ncbi:hypothetical protein [Achromobacter aloeverae]|uniref:Uncharacterized protein n=1 Tax=Achromobacter aloeverae TaxID=1750518 RepID=A0A4Q1HKF0_9BURK|nr:hypothetical protein [Achromobacter aloeverae]RXN90419.1 hypothetical protein C7R54_13015 [Achromobacter aloeverae]